MVLDSNCVYEASVAFSSTGGVLMMLLSTRGIDFDGQPSYFFFEVTFVRLLLSALWSLTRLCVSLGTNLASSSTPSDVLDLTIANSILDAVRFFSLIGLLVLHRGWCVGTGWRTMCSQRAMADLWGPLTFSLFIAGVGSVANSFTVWHQPSEPFYWHNGFLQLTGSVANVVVMFITKRTFFRGDGFKVAAICCFKYVVILCIGMIIQYYVQGVIPNFGDSMGYLALVALWMALTLMSFVFYLRQNPDDSLSPYPEYYQLMEELSQSQASINNSSSVSTASAEGATAISTSNGDNPSATDHGSSESSVASVEMWASPVVRSSDQPAVAGPPFSISPATVFPEPLSGSTNTDSRSTASSEGGEPAQSSTSSSRRIESVTPPLESPGTSDSPSAANAPISIQPVTSMNVRAAPHSFVSDMEGDGSSVGLQHHYDTYPFPPPPLIIPAHAISPDIHRQNDATDIADITQKMQVDIDPSNGGNLVNGLPSSSDSTVVNMQIGKLSLDSRPFGNNAILEDVDLFGSISALLDPQSRELFSLPTDYPASVARVRLHKFCVSSIEFMVFTGCIYFAESCVKLAYPNLTWCGQFNLYVGSYVQLIQSVFDFFSM